MNRISFSSDGTGIELMLKNMSEDDIEFFNNKFDDISNNWHVNNVKHKAVKVYFKTPTFNQEIIIDDPYEIEIKKLYRVVEEVFKNWHAKKGFPKIEPPEHWIISWGGADDDGNAFKDVNDWLNYVNKLTEMNDEYFIKYLVGIIDDNYWLQQLLQRYLNNPSKNNMDRILNSFVMFSNRDYYKHQYFRRLLKMRTADANAFATSSKNQRLIHIAVQQPNNAEYVKALLENGADVNVAESLNWTPLHCVLNATNILSNEDKDTYISLLSMYGVKMNQYNSDGYTPLHVAIIKGDNINISLLLKNGSNINQPCGKTRLRRLFGYTPLRLAHICKNQKAIDMLSSRGANRWFGNSGWGLIYALAPTFSLSSLSVWEIIGMIPKEITILVILVLAFFIGQYFQNKKWS